MPQKSRSVNDGSCQNIRLDQIATESDNAVSRRDMHEESPPVLGNGTGGDELEESKGGGERQDQPSESGAIMALLKQIVND